MAVFSELLCAVIVSVVLVGTADGGAGQTAAGDTNPAVTATGNFALDLYRQLAAKRRGENLFFSPFSMSSVLAMAAEGARGETAMEMGKVLRFPSATRNTAADARSRPWNTALIHAGMATLEERFRSKPVPKKLEERIASLRKQLDEANRAAQGEPIIVERPGKRPGEIEIEARPPTDEDFEKRRAAAKRSQELAGELNKLLPEVDLYELRAANAVWCEKNYPFQPAYLETIRKFYRTGGAFFADFSGDAERERQRINAWIESQTSRRICDLVPSGGLDEKTRLVLTNAIYFKGQWLKPFEASETKDEDFTLAAGSKVRVPMMHHEHLGVARYAAFNADGTLFPTPDGLPRGGWLAPETLYPGKGGFQIAESPYKGGTLAMAVILPRDADGLPALEQKLTRTNLEAWLGRLQQREIQLHLTGNMSRYMWSMDGIRFSNAEPLPLILNERIRITLVNDTMMNHPIHLHGMWSDLETGDPGYIPRKHTILVQPGSKISYLVTPDMPGDWAYHCHLLYHMMGMFRRVRVSEKGAAS